MRSKTLELTLLFVTAITKPKSWVLSAVGFYFVTVFKWVSEGQAIYFNNWKSVLHGMLNPAIPIEQKFFLVGFFCLLMAVSLYSLGMIKLVAIELDNRFGQKR